MSVLTTLCITRSKAIDYINDHFHSETSDSLLAGWLDVLLRDHYYNAIIVSDDEPNNDNARIEDLK